MAGRPQRVADAPLNTPMTLASTYVAGGDLGYGRFGNPGWSALEEAIGALEHGWALAFATGMAAANAILETLPRNGKLVIPSNCYLGVAALAQDRARRDGLQVVPVPATDTAAILSAAEGADVVWLESPTNPMMDVADLPTIGAALSGTATRLVVDNTFATPVLQQPLSLGADVVLHSATKFMSGHSDALLGALVTRDDAEFTQFDDIRKTQGATPGTLEAFLVLRGIRTLPLRVRAAETSARTLSHRLSTNDGVSRVRYPGWGSLLAIELPTAEDADAMTSATRIWVNTTSLGGVESTFERRRRWPAELANVPEGLIRMSVGVEQVDDLWLDLLQALQGTGSR